MHRHSTMAITVALLGHDSSADLRIRVPEPVGAPAAGLRNPVGNGARVPVGIDHADRTPLGQPLA